MIALIVIGLLAGLPALLAVVGRVNAVYLFAAVAGGSLLARYLGYDAGLALGMVGRQPVMPYAGLAILLLPAVLTLLFMRRTMAKSRLVLSLLPIILISLMLAVIALPLVPPALQSQIKNDKYILQLASYQNLIVGAASAATMALMLLGYRHKEDKKGKGH